MARSHAPAPVVDARLAAVLAHEHDPVEVLEDALAFAFEHAVHTATVEELLERGRLVSLGCGHFKLTKALNRAACARCGEMIRSGWDYDGFRRLGAPDTFSWPGDPLRSIHEPVALDRGSRYDPTGG